jgi:hypothetical protein
MVLGRLYIYAINNETRSVSLIVTKINPKLIEDLNVGAEIMKRISAYDVL